MATAADEEGIPTFLKMPTEERKAEWIKSPPRATAQPKDAATMAKTKPPKRAKSDVDKNATLFKMLSGKGSSANALCKALGWLPHTLRARISRLNKPKSKGGEGLKVERNRVDGVTTYRIA